MNYVESYIVDAIHERLLAGQSIRAIEADLEISKGTVSRYRKQFLSQHQAPIFCECGSPAFHRGWCSARYKKSAARQAFIARWQLGRPPAILRIKSPPRLDLQYPFIPPQGSGSQGVDLVLLVNGQVPRGLPDELRGDVCQEIIAAVLAGELATADIPRQMRSYIKRVRTSVTDYMAFSIDAPRRDGRSWHDVISDTGEIA